MHACVWVCAWYVRVCDHAWGLEVRGDFSVVAGVGLVVIRRGGGMLVFLHINSWFPMVVLRQVRALHTFSCVRVGEGVYG